MPIVLDQELLAGNGLVLTRVWFNAAADLSDLCTFIYAGDAIANTASQQGEVRQLVGRRRVVTRGGRVYESFSFILPGCSEDQVAWLADHVGAIVCVRDHVGSKVYGVFFEVPRQIATSPRTDGNYRSDLTLSFEPVDHSEAVV